MEQTINIYCDESCHLPNDGQKAMVLGGVWCFKTKSQEHNDWILDLKKRHNLSRYYEIKWSKVSNGKLSFYMELLDYFFTVPAIGFRAWIIPDKSILKHEEFNQKHDDWYYKMYFYLLRNLIWQDWKYHIYLDVKDTRSRNKLKKLKEVLQNANYDFSRERIQRLQHVHSHEIGLMQLADVLIGAMSYQARGLSENKAKLALIEHIRSRTGLTLTRNTLPGERKFNLCFWHPENGGFIHA